MSENIQFNEAHKDEVAAGVAHVLEEGKVKAQAKFIDVLCEGPIEGWYSGSGKGQHDIYLDNQSLAATDVDLEVVNPGAHFELKRGSGLQTPLSKDYSVLGVEIPYSGAEHPFETEWHFSESDPYGRTPLLPDWGAKAYHGIYPNTTSNRVPEDWGPYYNTSRRGTWVGFDYKTLDVQIRSENALRVDGIKLTLNFPRGFFAQHGETGNVEAIDCFFDVWVKPFPKANPDFLIPRIKHQMIGSNTSQFEADYIVELPGHWLEPGVSDQYCEETIEIIIVQRHRWQIQLALWEDRIHTEANLIRWAKLTRGVYKYPYTAYVGLTLDSHHFNKVPSRAYDLKLKKVRIPSNYNPITKTYSGIWDGKWKRSFLNEGHWTDNPAWCFLDLVTNERYGLGLYIDDNLIDKWTLYKIAKYCDEKIYTGFGSKQDPANYEPRFTCNMLIKERQEAFNVIQDMASIFRGMIYWNGQHLTAMQEAPSFPVAHFNNSNVINGEFNYSGTSLKARHTAVLVKYLDPDSNFEERVEFVEDRDAVLRYGYREKEVVGLGCTSRSQAHRIGRWLLLSEKAETDAVSFSTGLEGVACVPGSIITIADVNKVQDRIGGRVVDYANRQITLDSSVYINPNLQYQISVVSSTPQQNFRADGTTQDTMASAIFPYTMEEYSLDRTDTYDKVTITQTPFEPIKPGDVWFLSSTTTTNNRYYKVLALEETDDNLYSVSAIEHYPDKYDIVEDFEELEVVEPPLALNFPAVADEIEVREYLQKKPYGEIIGKIDIQWDAVGYTTGDHWTVSIRRQNRDAKFRVIKSRIYGTSYLYEPIEPGVYKIRVQGYNPLGLPGPYKETPWFEVFGKTAPPADVQNFQANPSGDQVILTWDANDEVDFDSYEIRLGTDWNTAEPLVDNLRSTRFSIKQDVSIRGYNFLIKAQDTSGNESLNAAFAKAIVNPPPNVRGFTVVQFRDRLDFTWKPIEDKNITGYEIRQANYTTDPIWEQSNLVAFVDVTKYSMPHKDTQAKVFMIKAKDVGGQYSAKASLAFVNTFRPPDMNLIESIDVRTDNNWQSSLGGGYGKYCRETNGELWTWDHQGYADFIFKAELDKVYTAQNSIESQFLVSTYDANDITWQEATYTWDANVAKRYWSVDFGHGSGQIYHEIATETNNQSLLTYETDAISFDPQVYAGAATGATYNGVEPIVAEVAPTQAWLGRHNVGLRIEPQTRVQWNLNSGTLPPEFSFIFWYFDWHYSSTIEILTLEGDTRSLKVWIRGSDNTLHLQEFYTNTQLDENNYILPSVINDISIDVSQFKENSNWDMCIGISQSSGKRDLYVCDIEGGSFASTSLNVSPVGELKILKV